MSFGLPFRCAISNGSVNLCLVNSTCFRNITSETESCIACSPGWTESYVGGHYPNCGTPILFLPIFFSVHLLITILGTFFMLRKLKRVRVKEQLRKFAYLCIAFCIVENIHVFAVFIEGGRFIFASLITIPHFALALEINTRALLMFAMSSVPVVRNKEKRRFERYLTAIKLISILNCEKCTFR